MANTVAALGPVPIDRGPLLARTVGGNTVFANNNVTLSGSPNLCMPTVITVTVAYTASVVPNHLLGIGPAVIHESSTMAVADPSQNTACMP